MVDFLLDQKSKELLKWGQSFPNPFRNARPALEVDQDKLIDVPDGAYLITSTASPRPLVSTYGMGPCVAVGLCYPDTKNATIAHFTTSTDPASLSVVLRDMQAKQNERIRAVIRGGDKENIFSVRLAVRLLEVIKLSGVNLYGVELFREEVINNGFAIDPNDGSLLKDTTSLIQAKPQNLVDSPAARRSLYRVYYVG